MESLNFVGKLTPAAIALTGDGKSSQIIATGSVAVKGDKGEKGDTGPASAWGTIPGDLSDQGDLQDALDAKEPTLSAGTSGQYYRGDKTWQTLDKSAVDLANVDNTSDLDKPVSTAQQTAINAKVVDTIVNGVTTVAPSQNAVYDALGQKIEIGGDLAGLITAPKIKKEVDFFVAPYSSTEAADYTCSAATGNEVEINAAINAASALPYGGIVFLKPGTYTVINPIVPKSNVTLRGAGRSTIIKTTSNIYAITSDGVTDVTGFYMEHFTCIGNRTTGQAAGCAFINGSLNPNTPGAPVISDIQMVNVLVKSTTSLPNKFFGLTNVRVYNCQWIDSLDCGFIYDDGVIVQGCYSKDSHDNGFSISRGCKKIACVGNTTENATFYGLWMSGFLGQPGPTEFALVGNTVKNSRNSGIALIGSPTNGVVSGNYVDQNHNQTGGDGTSHFDGIEVEGDNTTTQYAANITISGNIIRNAARGGITIHNAKYISITGNQILDTGTQFDSDGVTPISPTDQTTNIGIFTSHLTNTQIWVDGNYIADTRSTPYMNYDIWKIQSGSSGIVAGQNYSFGARNDRNRLDLINIPVEAGNDVALNVNGPDANINARLNLQGAGTFFPRSASSNPMVSVSTNTSVNATVSHLLAAGSSNTGYVGGTSATRLGDLLSSVVALRALADGVMTPAGLGALAYVAGLPDHSLGFFGFSGGLRGSRTEVLDTAYTILLQDYIVAYKTLTTAHNVTLPDATACAGQILIVKDEAGTASTANLTLVTVSGQTIDGTSTRVININLGQIAVYSDGTNWRIQGGLYNATTQKLVDTATSQTIAGVKTFSSEPVVPTPTGATSAANKAYVDAAVGSPSVRGFTTCVSDFMANVSTPPWIATAISSGTISAGTGSSSHPGIARMASSTTTNSGFRLQTNTTAMVIGGGESTDIVFNVPTTANTTCYLGFHNSSTNAAPVDGAYITISGTTLQGNTSANSTSSTTGTTYTITQSAWYHLNITVNAAANLVTYTLYDMSETQLWQDTLSTNIPSTSRTLGHGTCSTNSGTSAVAVLEVDYMSLQINRTLTR